jgi:hypothetical protein
MAALKRGMIIRHLSRFALVFAGLCINLLKIFMKFCAHLMRMTDQIADQSKQRIRLCIQQLVLLDHLQGMRPFTRDIMRFLPGQSAA